VVVTKACQRLNFKLLTWKREAELKAQYPYVPIRTSEQRLQNVSLIPDGYFAIETPKGVAHSFLEQDMSTMPTEDFASKIRAYDVYYESGAYQRDYQAKSLRVLTVTTSPERMANLMRTVGQVQGKHRFWFTLLNHITAESVLDAPIWSVPIHPEKQPLIQV
jgi:hypothetical protein